jgi:protein phosphatase
MSIKLIVHGSSDKGMVRENNEDNFGIDESTGLMIVCDGAGGHLSGETASKIAVEVIQQQIDSMVLKGSPMTMGTYNDKLSKKANQLSSAVSFANRVIFEASKKYPANYGMATTCVSVIFDEKHFAYCNVGDSRIYLIRDGQMKQLTNDHSLVMEQVRQGLLSADQAENVDYKNVITRALGIGETVEVDTNEMPLVNGDYLLLCTDGLLRMVDDPTILQTILEQKEPNQICTHLINMANERGGKDNITIIICQVLKEEKLFDKLWSSIKR